MAVKGLKECMKKIILQIKKQNKGIISYLCPKFVFYHGNNQESRDEEGTEEVYSL